MANKKDTKGRNLKQNEDQLKDGRYRYRYTDKSGNRRNVYSWKLVPTDKIPLGKREDISLREKIKNIEKDLDEGINIYGANVTVNQLIERYLDTKSKIVNATKGNYLHMLDKNIRNSKLGKMRIGDVRKSDIQKYYSYLYRDRSFTVNTIQLYQNLLYPSFQLAVDDLLIRINPCKGCMKEYVRGSMSSTKYPLNKEQQDALLKFTKENTYYSHLYTMISLMLGSGMRISETLGITWRDIDFENKVISVNHQLIYKKKDGKCVHYISLPKNKDTRKIPLQDNVARILKQYMQETYFISKSSGIVMDGHKEFLFLNREGNLVTPNTIVRAFHGIRDAYNNEETENAISENREPKLLPDFSPHTLRHTFCTRMAENGLDMKVLQEIMGHKNISVTMQVYNHVDEERAKNAVQELPQVIEAI